MLLQEQSLDTSSSAVRLARTKLVSWMKAKFNDSAKVAASDVPRALSRGANVMRTKEGLHAAHPASSFTSASNQNEARRHTGEGQAPRAARSVTALTQLPRGGSGFLTDRKPVQ